MSGPNPNRLQNAASLSALLLLGLGLSSFARASTPIAREAAPALPRSLKTERVYDRERLDALGVPRPSRLAFDGAGNLYVLDPQSRRVVKLDPSGAPAVELGGYGEDAASFSLPSDLAIDSRQSLLVLDRGKGAVIAFDGAGRWLASRAVGEDVAPEAFAPAARLLVDPFGSLWILAARERDLVPLDERLRRARQSRFLAPEDSLGTPSSAVFLPGGGGWVYDQDAAALRRFDTGGRLIGAVSLADSSTATRAADLAADMAGISLRGGRRGPADSGLRSGRLDSIHTRAGGSQNPVAAHGAGRGQARPDRDRRSRPRRDSDSGHRARGVAVSARPVPRSPLGAGPVLAAAVLGASVLALLPRGGHANPVPTVHPGGADAPADTVVLDFPTERSPILLALRAGGPLNADAGPYSARADSASISGVPSVAAAPPAPAAIASAGDGITLQRAQDGERRNGRQPRRLPRAVAGSHRSRSRRGRRGGRGDVERPASAVRAGRLEPRARGSRPPHAPDPLVQGRGHDGGLLPRRDPRTVRAHDPPPGGGARRRARGRRELERRRREHEGREADARIPEERRDARARTRS